MESRRLPGTGAGPSPDRMIIGSEGALGVIVEAWMRLQGRPRFRADAAFGFPDFFAAARAVRAVAQAGLFPSNLRVIDNDEAGTYGVNAYEESLVVLAFESADHPVDAWMARAVELMADHGGRRHADEAAALRWRMAFIRMPYARELTVPMGVINDTFESAITWDRFEAFHGAVRKATEEALKEATGRSGTVSTRFTHVYPDGPAVYYTFNVRGDPDRLIEQWRQIKTRASDALIEAGGTITHHHAVGRDHMPWYRIQRAALFGAALAAQARARPGGDSQSGGAPAVRRRPRSDCERKQRSGSLARARWRQWPASARHRRDRPSIGARAAPSRRVSRCGESPMDCIILISPPLPGRAEA